MTSLERDRNDGERARPRGRQTADEAPDAPRADRRPPLVSSLGNAAVQRLLRSERDEEHPAVDDSVEQAIDAKRGGGRPVDREAGARIGQALGADLGDVRVHDDAEADALNESVSADAFTNGSDIFFRQGKYQPGTGDGDRLLAHELAHVVQQRDAPVADDRMRVSSPDDTAEREASAFSERLASTPSGGAPAVVGRQEEMDDEEEELYASASLDRQEDFEEEEELYASASLDRQEEVEDEEELLSLSRRRDAGGPQGARGA